MRVVNIDANHGIFPSNFHPVTNPKPVCTMTASGTCKSAFFSSQGIAYSEVRGYAFGYQVVAAGIQSVLRVQLCE